MASPSRCFHFLLCPVLTTAFLLHAQGALTWTTQQIDLTTKPSDIDVVGLFPFKNIGQSTVTVTTLQTSCDCTTAVLEKRAYAPGESGEIKAVFTLHERVGEQRKSIHVTTDEPVENAVILIMNVMIPELLTTSPRFLRWKTSEKPSEKSAKLTAESSLKFTGLALTYPLPAELTARLEPVEAGISYQLIVRPLTTGKSLLLPLAGTATFTDGTTRPFKIYVLLN